MPICPHCGSGFCPDNQNPGEPPQVYCTQECARTGRRARVRNRQAAAHRQAVTARKQRAVCKRKRNRSFATEEQALDAWETNPWPSTVGGVYHCPNCGKWHITSNRNGSDVSWR